MNMPEPIDVKYIVESSNDAHHLLWLLLTSKGIKVEQCSMGNSLWADGDKGLVSLTYDKIDGEWYCFYEPTSVEVDWNKVEFAVRSKFIRSTKVKMTDVFYKSNRDN